jgi:predicted amidohydrolase
MTNPAVAVVQMQSTPDLQENLKVAEQYIREARRAGADMIVLPENISCIAQNRRVKWDAAALEADHEAVRIFSALSRELAVWIVGGSIGIRMAGDKLANRLLVYSPLGAIVGRYDKIHLFDADPKPGESYRESDDIVAGDKAVIVQTPWGGMGLTICYDVRFPPLFHALAKAGASLIVLPAAFTETTGKAHWHVLVRARAIETGCFVLAAAQGGTHDGGRRTFGHSMIVDPWGEILAEAEEAPGIILATLDLGKVTRARKALPVLEHGRPFEGP